MAALLASLVLAACGGGDPAAPIPVPAPAPAPAAVVPTAPTSVTTTTTTTTTASAPLTTPTTPTPPPERTAADVTFSQTTFAEGVSVDPATGSLYIGTGGDSSFAVLRAAATETAFGNWLSASGILPSGSLVVGTRVQGDTLYFCASNPLTAVSKVWAYPLGTQAKTGEFALPAGFCNDLAFDAAGNLFATSNRTTPASTEAIYKLSAATLASGTAAAADWAVWYTAPAGFALNGLAFEAAGNRLLWADNGSVAGTTRIQASATSGATARQYRSSAR
jgi:hypothetical protein